MHDRLALGDLDVDDLVWVGLLSQLASLAGQSGYADDPGRRGCDQVGPELRSELAWVTVEEPRAVDLNLDRRRWT